MRPGRCTRNSWCSNAARGPRLAGAVLRRGPLVERGESKVRSGAGKMDAVRVYQSPLRDTLFADPSANSAVYTQD